MSAATPHLPRRAPIDVVVVGAATRDVADDDPRGWRLGGATCFAALAMARLGLRVVAVVGADPLAAEADELGLLHDAGVETRIVPLRRGPVFENLETPTGRLQRIRAPSDAMPQPAEAGLAPMPGARGWFLAPVADELPGGWIDVIPAGAPVAIGWQGLLRTFRPDGAVVRRDPGPSPFLARATLASVSRDDLVPTVELRALAALLRPETTLALTHGEDGGIVLDPADPTGHRRLRRFDAIPARRVVDVTGAGDTFLAALFAARLEPRLVGGRETAGFDLLLAAAAASLAVEGHGLAAIPSRSAVRDRMREGLSLAAARRNRGG